MLKGHVFSRQLFESHIFAVFMNTFLNGKNGIVNDYRENMEISHDSNSLTIHSGVVCIQGRFLEEDSTFTLIAGNDNSYCKLIIEVNLDLQNTENDFKQGTYKIIKNANQYPNLTQEKIVKNNAGIYQFELARFKTSEVGITEFTDKRTFLDFSSIYKEIEEHIKEIDNGSLYLEKSGGTITGDLTVQGTLNANANTAKKLEQAKNIKLIGDITGNADFDGSDNIEISTEAL